MNSFNLPDTPVKQAILFPPCYRREDAEIKSAHGDIIYKWLSWIPSLDFSPQILRHG